MENELTQETLQQEMEQIREKYDKLLGKSIDKLYEEVDESNINVKFIDVTIAAAFETIKFLNLYLVEIKALREKYKDFTGEPNE